MMDAQAVLCVPGMMDAQRRPLHIWYDKKHEIIAVEDVLRNENRMGQRMAL